MCLRRTKMDENGEWASMRVSIHSALITQYSALSTQYSALFS